MNQNQLNRLLAINYAILKKLVQDENEVNRLITKDNLLELLDVQTFYHTHFSAMKFVEFFPMVYGLLRRETEASFAQLKPRIRIYNRYEKEYPISFFHDLGQNAPLFIYTCGDIDLFDRRLPKLVLVSTMGKTDKMIQASLDLLDQFDGSKEVLVLSQQTPLNHIVYSKIHTLSVSSIVFVNNSLNKSIFKSTFFPCNQTKIKHLLITAISPDETNLDQHQLLTDTLAVSMSKAGILLSDQASDLKLESCLRLLTSHKPIIVPFFDYARHELILPLRPEHLRENIDLMLHHPHSK
jgi:hypothetical protein